MWKFGMLIINLMRKWGFLWFRIFFIMKLLFNSVGFNFVDRLCNMFWIWGCNLYYLRVLTYCSILEALKMETSVWAMLMSHLLTKHTPSRVFVIAKTAIWIWFGMLPLPIQDFSYLMQREFNSGTLNATGLEFRMSCSGSDMTSELPL
jgi:hypothetical protein